MARQGCPSSGIFFLIRFCLEVSSQIKPALILSRSLKYFFFNSLRLLRTREDKQKSRTVWKWRRFQKLRQAMQKLERKSSKPSALSATPSRKELATSKVTLQSVFVCVYIIFLCMCINMLIHSNRVGFDRGGFRSLAFRFLGSIYDCITFFFSLIADTRLVFGSDIC